MAIVFDPNRVQDTDKNKDYSDIELLAGVIDTSSNGSATGITLESDVQFGSGGPFKWKDILDAYAREPNAKVAGQAAQVTPEDVLEGAKRNLIVLALQKENEIEQKKRDLEENSRVSSSDTVASQELKKIEDKTHALVKDLQDIILQIQKKNIAQGKPMNTDIPAEVLRLAGKSEAAATNGAGNISIGSESKASFSSSFPGPSGGVAAQGIPSPYTPYGGPAQGSPYGPAFGTPFSTDAYARALYTDDMILNSWDGIGKSQREGQRLIMLFFYFARMAESGDLGAMYQFIKFINYIVAKDKAKQNIDMATQLIKLQDASRRSTNLLLSAESPDGTDQKKANDFLKLMHQVKSEESTIATSQKLIADMLQEMAHVVEALVNSTKFMADAWGRVLRTASSRA